MSIRWVALCLLCALARAAVADDHAHHHAPPASEVAPPLAIPDVSVIDQRGAPRRFYTDLVKGKTVVIDFVFTSCTTVCPPLGARYAQLQERLGERLDREVRLLSISVDPANDTPERLAAWAEKFDARPGWTLVTGDKQQLDVLLRKLNASSASPAEHTPMLWIGNEATGTWQRISGLSSTDALMGAIDTAAASARELP